MEVLSRLLVQQPLNIFLVAAAFMLAWVFWRPRNKALHIPALAWLAYALWETLVLIQTPEANIRVDLLLIWPLVGVATLWPLLRWGWHKLRSKA